MKGGVALEDREREKDAETPPMKKMKMTDFFSKDRDDKENGVNGKENARESEMRSIEEQVKVEDNNYKEEKLNEEKFKIPKVIKMRMTDSLPKGCDMNPKMRMTDSLPKGCEVKNLENDGMGRREDEEDVKEGEERNEEQEEEKKEYTMNVFNFRKANLWFKAIDLLKVDLTKDPLLKHYHPEGWHPPKPCPPRRQYAPTKDIIGQTPEGDQTWVDPPTFYPTLEEFSNLTKYVEYMESQGAHRAGICKIVPPKEWVPRREGYNPADIEGIDIKPVQQDIAVGKFDGAFKTISDRSRPEIDVDGYRRLATSAKYLTPAHNSYEELEELYWKQNLDEKAMPPIYGADVCDTLTDEDQKAWNIKRLDSLLTEVMEEQIPGVNLPYLYFGMWKATFSWHVEDMDLYSVNYIHWGAPKTWYCIPPQFGYQLEQVAQKLFPDFASSCFNLLRHKALMIGPKLLEANGVRVQKVVHEAGSMIIVFPHAYHSGFNHGFNMAESTNFAVRRWVEYGKRFRDCVCRDQDDDVSINMTPFVKEVQPERFEAYEEGRDYALHPEDPWYIRRCLQDAIARLERDEIDHKEFEQLKKELRRKRQIPAWFKERFILDYDDQIDVVVDPSDYVEDLPEQEEVDSPRVRQAKKRLKERLSNGSKICNVNMKILSKAMTDMYKGELDAYNEMLADQRSGIESLKEAIKAKEDAGGHGKGAAKGVGFKGVDEAELLEQKAKVTCLAKKQHRFNMCKKCSGCRAENCGECEFCEDMPRFGGLGVKKQKCVLRVCVNPILRTCDQCVWNV